MREDDKMKGKKSIGNTGNTRKPRREREAMAAVVHSVPTESAAKTTKKTPSAPPCANLIPNKKMKARFKATDAGKGIVTCKDAKDLFEKLGI